jgi:Tol biopolymer transport system component
MGRHALVLVGVLLALAAAPGPAVAAFPGANGRLAFDGYPSEGPAREIYTMNPDGSDLRRLTTDSVPDTLPAWSPDGRRIAFVRGTFPDLDIYVMNADGSGLTQLTSGPAYDSGPAWSPDGTKIAFSSNREGGYDVYSMNPDGTAIANLTGDDSGGGFSPAWSPDGTEIAYSRHTDNLPYPAYYTYTGGGEVLYRMNPDGSGKTPIQTSDHGDCEFFVGTAQADWSPNGARIGYLNMGDNDGDPCRSIETVRRDWTGPVWITGAYYANSPAWSPDGTRLAYGFQVYNDFDEWEAHIGIKSFSAAGHVIGQVDLLSDVSAANPDWQPLPARGYPRPQGATPVRLALVPAFAQCTSPDREHGSPLAFGSCTPPVQSSTYVTIGEEPAQSTARARLRVRAGDPATPLDEADVLIDVHATDVRVASDLSDYTGTLRATPRIRITDMHNTPNPGGPGPGTVTDLDLDFDVPCTGTPDESIGATCSVTTTADALSPDTVRERLRSTWALQSFELSDGGPAGSPVDRPFLVPGVFVP